MANEDKFAENAQATIPLQMNVTEGALFTPDDFSIKPHNWVNIYGPPGATVLCSTSEGGIIGDHEPQPYAVTLVRNGDFQGGFGKFPVKCNPPSTDQDTSELQLIIVSAYDADSADNQVMKGAAFSEGLVDTGLNYLIGYNASTSAPNDGATPCSIYLLVQPDLGNGGEITYALVQIIDDSHAEIQDSTNPKSRQVPLNPDGSATVEIINTHAEQVSVRIGIPQSPDGDSITLGERSENPPLVFSRFPA